MVKPTIIIREFQCPNCSKRHEVEGRRRDLNMLQNARIDKCKRQEQLKYNNCM